MWSSRGVGVRKVRTSASAAVAASSSSGGEKDGGRGGGGGGGGGSETIGVLRRRVDALSEKVGKVLQVVDVERLDACVADLDERAADGALWRGCPCHSTLHLHPPPPLSFPSHPFHFHSFHSFETSEAASPRYVEYTRCVLSAVYLTDAGGAG